MKKLAFPTLIAVTLASGPAFAFDEDTCGDTAANASSPYVANCAPITPLGGTQKDRTFDHAVAHWEFTYLLARCAGVPDDKAEVLAASDEATDMSSPYCGSYAVYQTDTTLAKEGYACGYVLSSSEATFDEGADDFDPKYKPSVQFAYTDRCYNGSQKPNSSGSTVSNQGGHGEFFHYPFWEVGTGQANLLRTEAWASGKSADLLDPQANCNMKDLSCNYSMKSGAPCNYTSGNKATCPKVCADTATSWSWPSPFAGDTSLGVDWPALGADDASFKRLGIYLHSLGDYSSHYLCQYYSGQTRNATTGMITVPPTKGANTSHTNFDESDAYRSCTKNNLFGYDACAAACSFDQHDCEFGTKGVDVCSDVADGSTVSGTSVDSILRSYSTIGLRNVLNYLVKVAGKTSTSSVTSMGYSVVDSFVAKAYAKDRYNYVKGQLTAKATATAVLKKEPCMCDDGAGTRGLFGWVAGTNKDAKGNVVYCCKEQKGSTGECPIAN